MDDRIYYVQGKKPDSRECTLHYSIYMKFKNRQKKWNVKEVKNKGSMVGGVGHADGEGHRETFRCWQCSVSRWFIHMCVYIYMDTIIWVSQVAQW